MNIRALCSFFVLVYSISISPLKANDLPGEVDNELVDAENSEQASELSLKPLLWQRIEGTLKRYWPLILGAVMGAGVGTGFVVRKALQAQKRPPRRKGELKEEVMELALDVHKNALSDVLQTFSFVKKGNAPLIEHLQAADKEKYQAFLKNLYFPGENNEVIDPTQAFAILTSKEFFPSLKNLGSSGVTKKKRLLNETDAMTVLVSARTRFVIDHGLSEKIKHDHEALVEKIKAKVPDTLHPIADMVLYIITSRLVDFVLKNNKGDLEEFLKLFTYWAAMLKTFSGRAEKESKKRTTHPKIQDEAAAFINVTVKGLRSLSTEDQNEFYGIVRYIFDKNIEWLEKHFPDKYQALDSSLPDVVRGVFK